MTAVLIRSNVPNHRNTQLNSMSHLGMDCFGLPFKIIAPCVHRAVNDMGRLRPFSFGNMFLGGI